MPFRTHSVSNFLIILHRYLPNIETLLIFIAITSNFHGYLPNIETLLIFIAITSFSTDISHNIQYSDGLCSVFKVYCNIPDYILSLSKFS